MNPAQVLQVVLALLFVLALLLLLAWVARRSGWLPGRAAQTGLRVAGSLRLNARHSLVVVDIEGKRLILGISPQQITLLDQQPQSPETAPGTRSAFQAALDKTRSSP